jgi:hypothetical protein
MDALEIDLGQGRVDKARDGVVPLRAVFWNAGVQICYPPRRLVDSIFPIFKTSRPLKAFHNKASLRLQSLETHRPPPPARARVAKLTTLLETLAPSAGSASLTPSIIRLIW